MLVLRGPRSLRQRRRGMACGQEGRPLGSKRSCLYLRDFESLEEAKHEIGQFIECYNHGWLLERHGYRTPVQARKQLTRKAA